MDRYEIKKEGSGNKLWNLSYLETSLVRQCDLTWKPIYDSVLLIHKKLTDLGFVYCGEEIIVAVSE